MDNFATQYKYGLAGESAIARWFRSRGHCVLPVYEKIFDTGKGPQIYTPTGRLIAPDLLIFKGDQLFWIEAKHKTAFSWHRITSRWVTGIDLHHYEQYQRVAEELPWPVWLMFLHEGGQAKDSPAVSPAGLFGNTLAFLVAHENHRSPNWGRTGMVYWAVESLLKIATLQDMQQIAVPIEAAG